MGTLAAGIKEIFATAKTTGSNVMLCGNDGTPDGHMTMANLASVLGGLQYKGNARDNDLNNLETGLYTLEGAENIISGSTIYGTLIVVKGSTTSMNHMGVFQIVYDINGKGVFYREQWAVGTWNTWKKITTGIPDFYKNYADLRSLANALGGIGETGSLARIVASGVLSSLYNPPTVYGTIIRFNAYYNVYICINYNGTGLWIAGDIGSGETENLNWYQVFQAT